MNRTQTVIAIALVLGSLSATARAETLSEELSEANKEGRIWTSFALNPHLDALDLGIDVEGETAILTGTVPGAIERDLAAEVALGISGVKRVDNRIKVDREWQRKPVPDGQRSPADIAEDATISASVKSKLLWSARVEGLKVDVDTIDRRVTLSGVVDSAAARDMAGRLAADTLGVRAVDNRLKVDPSLVRTAPRDPVSDSWITARVKNSLLYSRHVDGLDIDVDTRAGVVNLKGSVSSPQERALAIELAENVSGVKRVDASGLRVNS
ncbi:MAG: BON domain-containing protein [Rhodanobacteraceae bacterium]|nr:BON domain-containing protein [Rhodanobacteraceae bacterium]